MNNKHESKLYKGFEKQYARQYKKPRTKTIELPKVQLPKNFKGIYKHEMEVSNSIWRGMNLNNLIQSFNKNRVGGMYGTFYIDIETGKYKLTVFGKNLLNKRKNKLLGIIK